MAAEDNPPIIGTAVQAWGDAFRAIAAMPALAGAVLAIQLIIGGASFLLMPDPLTMTDGIGPMFHLLAIATGVVQSFLVAPLAIAVHRYVLLGETTNRYSLDPSSPRYLRFVGFAVLVSLIWSVPNLIGSFLPSGKQASMSGGILTFVFFIIVAVITTRRAILFPAIAVDAPGATWRNARNDTKGHSWRVAFTFVCAAVPIIVVTMPLTFLFLMPSGMGTPGRIAYAIISPVMQVLTICAFAAAASHLYRAFATNLQRPSGAI